MAWTEITRAGDVREGLRCAGDLPDVEWAPIAPPLMPLPVGRPRTTD